MEIIGRAATSSELIVGLDAVIRAMPRRMAPVFAAMMGEIRRLVNQGVPAERITTNVSGLNDNWLVTRGPRLGIVWVTVRWKHDNDDTAWLLDNLLKLPFVTVLDGFERELWISLGPVI